MKNIVFIITLLCCSSCATKDRTVLHRLVNNKQRTIIIRENEIGRRNGLTEFITGGKRKNFPVSIFLKTDKTDNYCYLNYSNTDLADFKFLAKELKKAKIFNDSIFDEKNKYLHFETEIIINSEQRNKLVGIVIKNKNYVSKVYESIKDNRVKTHQLYNIVEFDEQGKITKKYQEYLY